VYGATAAACFALGSILPAMLIGLPRFYGAWHHVRTGLTQHAGLAEATLDHRLNSRTVYLNPVSRFVYWTMTYPVEHHMFPMVPSHALPALHEEMKADCPPAYPSLWAAYREIVPTVLRQLRDPTHFVRRQLPAGSPPARPAPVPAAAAWASDARIPPSPTAAVGKRWPPRASREEEDDDHELDRGVRRGRHRAGGRDPLRLRRAHLRDLPLAGRPVLRDRRLLHPRAGASRGRPRDRRHHRMPQAQRPLRLPDGRGQGRSGLRQPPHLPGPGRERQGPDRHRRLGLARKTAVGPALRASAARGDRVIAASGLPRPPRGPATTAVGPGNEQPENHTVGRRGTRRGEGRCASPRW